MEKTIKPTYKRKIYKNNKTHLQKKNLQKQ